jgi:hypothetical protein
VARAVVGAQVGVLRWLAGRRRATSAALVAVAWAATCAAVIAGGHLGRGGAVQIALAAAMVIVAAGESMLSPARPVIVDDPVPPAVTGPDNRPGTLALTAGGMLGPAVVAAALGAGWGTSLLTTLAVACALASIAVRRSGRHRPVTSVPRPVQQRVYSSRHGQPGRHASAQLALSGSEQLLAVSQPVRVNRAAVGQQLAGVVEEDDAVA